MSHIYSTDAPKKATNLSVNSDLLRQAKEYGINLSATFEKSLEEMVRKEKEKRWLEENKEAIDAYNERIKKYGTIGQRMGRFRGTV
ncbi:type II toxin-antitoxin system CcdA family antitoxin [Sulfurovum riftiae]|uniref:Acetoacetyl-CoA synthase n=1 Tax=Sulfurovum riftiae TaxID=1630136 RepID=A0A151CGB1_9BACT|nr:type II toxin-antitoxin system CcdA family antitoxin [Sulfurovum riftiae]KYJ86575.1 acetoacetyl-CoA synthase [Sulfurovum riftiae]